jgi:hypothetical protein
MKNTVLIFYSHFPQNIPPGPRIKILYKKNTTLMPSFSNELDFELWGRKLDLTLNLIGLKKVYLQDSEDIAKHWIGLGLYTLDYVI